MSHDERLRRVHAGTAADLGLLDVEAGLREALIAAQHTHTGHDLDLDIEAGLHAVTPTPVAPTQPSATPSPGPPRRPRPPTPLQPKVDGAVASRLMSMDIVTLLEQRNHPPVVALALSLTLLLAKTTSRILTSDHDLARELNHELALQLARELTREIVRAGDLARDLGHDVDSILEITNNISRDYDVYSILELARGPYRDPDTSVRPGALERALNHALHIALDFVQRPAWDVAGDLTYYLDYDFDTTRGLGGLLDRDPHLTPARLRADVLHRGRTLDLARHDFTQADFSGVDLSNVSLIGIRWSMTTTRWPSEQWRAHALLNSRELDDGTYEIQDGNANVRIHST